MEILIVLVIGCVFWGFIGKAMAAARGMNERSGFWLGFLLWIVGLIVIAAAKPHSDGSSRGDPGSAGPTPSAPAAQPVPARTRLAELDALRSDGLITDDEYEAKRRRILEDL